MTLTLLFVFVCTCVCVWRLKSRPDWRLNWRTESSMIRRRISVFGRFIYSESVIVKTIGIDWVDRRGVIGSVKVSSHVL
jgi:hypothetical protein